MKRAVSKVDAEALRKEYPIEGLLPGWFFRVREISAGAYVGEGVDRWGRVVSHQGNDPESLIQSCVLSARESTERQSRKFLLLAVAAWAVSLLLIYWFGVWGPFGRYSLVVELGVPAYFTYRLVRSREPNANR